MLQYVKVGRPQAGLTVSLRDGNQVFATADIRYRDRPRPLMSDANLILSLGGEIGVAQAMARDATAIDVQVKGTVRYDRYIKTDLAQGR